LKKKVIVIVGPTASGKTNLAVNLAKKINGEIISADSMQAYKGMDIISQSPTPLERSRAKHHLISFLDPRKEYSAVMFSKKADKTIADIVRRKKTPIVVGGSGLYVKALIDGVFPSKGKDEAFRERLRSEAKKNGNDFLHARLREIDPVSAGKIHPNDVKKIIRALEIYETHKKTKSHLQKKTKGIKDKYDVRMFGITMERKILYEKINARVDEMFKRGLVAEAKRLLTHAGGATSSLALGVKEARGFLEGSYGIGEAAEALKKNTRRFAKRQLTWFRADRRIKWIDINKTSLTESVNFILNRMR